jgi:nicotinate-nucleotide--dimethylbenzimidazole phosphoribosyltransferase
VQVRDGADQLLTTPGSLGVLDRAVDRLLATGGADPLTGTLVLAPAGTRCCGTASAPTTRRSPRTCWTPPPPAARWRPSPLQQRAWSCWCWTAAAPPATCWRPTRSRRPPSSTCSSAAGRRARRPAGPASVALGEVGIGNTTVAAALCAAALDLPAEQVVGLGAGADAAVLEAKRRVVDGALQRARQAHGDGLADPRVLLGALGGPELVLLTGVVLGAVEAGAVVVLDGLATGVSALLAVRLEPAVAAYLVAGQRSREQSHAAVLGELGLEPLLDLRLRAGEGVGGPCGAAAAPARAAHRTARPAVG